MGVHRRLRSAAAVAATVAVLAAAGAASCGPTGGSRGDGDRVPRASVEPSPTELRGSLERHSELEVAAGLRPTVMEFHDAFTGYVWLSGCDNGCRGALFATFDGGLSWVERAVPATTVPLSNLSVVDARTLVMTTEQDGWYRSTDGGRTFARGGDGQPGPADLTRGATVGCPTGDGDDCRAAVLVDGRPVPARPPLPGALRDAGRAPPRPAPHTSSPAATPDVLYAVSTVDDETVHTAASTDGGRTWTVPAGPLRTRGTGVVRLAVSRDGRDVWLLTSTGTDTASVHRLEPAGWREVRADVPVNPLQVSGAAVGEGALAVTGTRFGYVYANGRWADASRPPVATTVRVLADGALMTTTSASDIWLGTGNGAARLWNRVTIDPKWR